MFLRTIGVGLLVISGVWLALTFYQKPITATQAEKFAIEQLERSGKQLGFDTRLFKGPRSINIARTAYGFVWDYSDKSGTIELIVSVDQYGGTEFAFDGDLGRLRAKN